MSLLKHHLIVAPHNGLRCSEGAAPLIVQQRIVAFHQDEEHHWVADLECGHTQHVRHDPPWQNRPWVLSAETRARFIGVTLNCVKCDALPSERVP